jgi:hypothetical protein
MAKVSQPCLGDTLSISLSLSGTIMTPFIIGAIYVFAPETEIPVHLGGVQHGEPYMAMGAMAFQ